MTEEREEMDIDQADIIKAEMNVADLIDATGLTCPLPLLKAKQGLNRLSSGQRLKVIATDPGSLRDFKSFAAMSGHILLTSQQQGQQYIYVIEKVC